ncbi:MAG: YihY/virulence factor BrkB family protein [Chloroflexota bacterium]|nr:YihY/virulence factor BrkB family protein [Chloroflexota bacterium]
MADIAQGLLETVLKETESAGSEAEDVAEAVSAAAVGTVAAAYQVSQSHGNRARERVLNAVARPGHALAPEVQRQLSDTAKKLSEELPRGRAAWRWSAMFRAGRLLFRAGRLLFQVGVNDQAAAMAYFSVLSVFLLVALAILGLAVFLDKATIRSILVDLGTYYLPVSSSLFRELVGGLLESYAALGLASGAGIFIVGNGLFMAVNRAIRRVFGEESRHSFRGNLAEALLIGVLGLALLASILMSASLQIILGAGVENVPALGEAPYLVRWALGTVAALAPAVVTGLVFTVLYHKLPHSHVELRDAVYGGIIALVLFEAGKHLFLFLSGMAAARLVVYGPTASAVVLLMWAYFAGVIFLYGAALTRMAGDLRPGSRPPAGSRNKLVPGGRK